MADECKSPNIIDSRRTMHTHVNGIEEKVSW